MQLATSEYPSNSDRGTPDQECWNTWSLALQVSQSSAESLQNLLAEAASMQSQPASSLEMVVMLLQLGRPRHFSSFKAFAQWRQSSAAAVCQSLALGAAGEHHAPPPPPPQLPLLQ